MTQENPVIKAQSADVAAATSIERWDDGSPGCPGPEERLRGATDARRSIDGSFLGHVFDLRCTWPPAKGRPVLVDELIHGQSGLLERVGLRHRKPDSVAWSDVVELRGKVIVVEKK